MFLLRYKKNTRSLTEQVLASGGLVEVNSAGFKKLLFFWLGTSERAFALLKYLEDKETPQKSQEGIFGASWIY
ncbi:hypothetical protein CJD36_011105 [Flavipsychrobacter stenotrophus]|uniref:Uncharacterized protein n=1 Tax=Flavipsychrobacter stenotrophus TaxID=2077091 RepID=A0A2S7SVF6_9BACT|nr:hypothetical protein CJD36_011105 [Flavipsychrobacter stenotrophus]